jgi:NADPH:quinone reductase-like Zn-dependent oxidoreductase
MKAAIFREYGPPEAVVRIEDVPKPAPKDEEVLIRVRAASVNPPSHFSKRSSRRASIGNTSASQPQKRTLPISPSWQN